jgi:hypothetical protein
MLDETIKPCLDLIYSPRFTDVSDFERGCVLIVSLFSAAKRFIQRKRTLAALQHEERYHFAAVAYHVRQRERRADDQEYHGRLARFRLASMRRVCDQQRMFETGKGFWELHDIGSWAVRARDFQRNKSPEFFDMFQRVPISARFALYQRVRELRWQEERASAEAYCATLPDLSGPGALAEFGRWVEAKRPGPRERERWCSQLSSTRHFDFGA